MPGGLLQQPIFIEPIRLPNEPFYSVAVDGPFEGALAHADEHLRRGRGGRHAFYPDNAQGVNAKRGTLLPKKLVDELLAAQVFLFWKSMSSGCQRRAASGSLVHVACLFYYCREIATLFQDGQK